MIFFSAVSFFAAFGLAAGIASLLGKLRPPAWIVGTMTVIATVAFRVLAVQLPFLGLLTEVPLVLLASVAASGPIYLWLHVTGEKKLRGPKLAALGIGCLGCAAAIFPMVFMRINYASWITWRCDGVIMEVTRNKGNHGNLMIVVRDGSGGTVRFEPVDGDFWDRAKPGNHLTKVSGSPTALLDGQRLRMVPRYESWHREPE